MKNTLTRLRVKQFAIGVLLFCIAALGCANERTKGSAHPAFACSFGPPQTLGPFINSPLFEGGPTVSSDGRTLIFTATRDPITQQEDLFISHRENPDASWGPPEPLGSEVNSPTDSEFSPRLSHDGKTLYFGSNRPGGFGSSDLYVSTRESPNHPWTPARNLGPMLNTTLFEAFATPSADGNTLYFERSTAAATPDADIWVSTRQNDHDEWSVPLRLSEPVNGPNGEFSPSISTDGLSLYFGSMREGNIGFIDIWVAHRSNISAEWGEPENLGPAVNSAFSLTLAPFITNNGKSLYFMSRRPGGLGQPGCQFINCLDLYVTECEPS
jgi:Tol biopolymer transport system component